MKEKNINANSMILNHMKFLEILLFHINAKNVIKLLVLFSLLIIYFNISFSQGENWLSGWLYRIPITITERSGNTLTDYQVLVTINTQNLISQGKMRNDCGDIRFTDSDGITIIPHYIFTNQTNYSGLSYSWGIYGCNSTNTFIRVKVPNIPANSNKIIYMYYGNPNATYNNNLYNIYTDTATAVTATLPSGRYGLSCAPYGDSIYCFGGYSGTILNEIVKYNVTSDTITVMSATLPSGRYYLSCAPYGDSIYCFGGLSGTRLNQIVRYNVTNNSVTTMSATLPSGRYGLSCAPYGDSIYCFGGYNGTYINEIVKYNVTSDTITVMSAKLPSGRDGLSCAPYGDSIYCFGGYNGTILNEIVKYNVTSDTITVMSAKLPSGRYYLSCAPYGDSIYCFGGFSGTRLNQIVRYNVTNNSVTTMSATLPSGRSDLSCAPYGDSIYCFGGYSGTSLNQIVRYATKFTSLEPTVSLGNEEKEAVFAITIYSPLNTTYYSNIVIINITTNCYNCEDISYSVKILLNNNEIYSANNLVGRNDIVFNYTLTEGGIYNLTVIANITNLNLVRTSSVIFTYVKPITTINIISPQNLTYTSLPINALIQINSTINHNVYVYLDGSLIFSQSYNASDKTINLQLNLTQEKTYNLTVLVNSSVVINHYNQSSVIFTLKPSTTINILSPQNTTYYSNIVNASIQVNSTIPHNVYIFLDNNLIFSQSYNASDKTINLQLNLTQEKTYNLTVLVNSSVVINHNNRSSVIFTFRAITIINIISPQNTTYYTNEINALIQINSTINHNVYVYLDGSLIFSQSYNASDKTINLQLNLTQEKTYNLTVLVNSSVVINHNNRSSVIFTLNLYDLIVSYSNFTLFNNVNYTQTLNYLITYRCGLLNAQKNIYLFVNETINKTYSLKCDGSTRTINDKLNFPDGFYSIRFSLETHRNTPSTTFYFDNTPPAINISYSIQTLFRTDITQTATYYANDITYAICTIRLNNNITNVTLKNNQTTLTAYLVDGKNVFEIICRDIVNNTNKLSIIEDLYVKNITLWEEMRNRIFNTSTLTNFNSLLIKSEGTGATYDFKANNRNNIFYVNYRNALDTLRLEFSYSNTADTILRLFDIDLIDSNLRICIHEQSTTFTEIYFVSSSQQKIALLNSISNCEVLNTRTKYLLQNSLAVKAYTLRTTYYLYKIDENNKKIFLALIDGSIPQIVNLDALQYFTKTFLTLFAEDITAEKVDDYTIKIYYKNLRNNNEYAIFRIYSDNKKIFEHEEYDNPNEFVLYFTFYGLNISDVLVFEVESNNGKFVRYFNKDARVGILSSGVAITLAVLVYLLGATISVRLQLGLLGLIFSLISIAILSLSIITPLTTFFIVIFLILAIFHIIVIRENVQIVT